jgi:hypothetical protein
MKDINRQYIWLVTALMMVLSGCDKEALGTFRDEGLNFVRFSLQLDNNNQLIRDITSVQNVREVDLYEHEFLDTIFVPVALSTAPRSAPVDISYSVTSSVPALAGDLYTIFPGSNSLTFAPDEQIRYVEVVFNRVWDLSEVVTLTLKLESSSDPDITLGYPRENETMDAVTIRFGGTDILNAYSLTTPSYTWPEGDSSVVDVEVVFAIPALQQEIGAMPDLLAMEPVGICNAIPDLAYTITPLPFPNRTTSITFRIQFDTDIGPEDELFYFIKLKPNIHPRYSLGAISEAVLIQSPERPRADVDAAGLFVNPTDPFNRLFGYAWRYDENDVQCEWSPFATFTQRVTVEPDDPNNNGQGVHKYIVAHRGTNVGTNPFNMRRYFSGASVSSPAYWLEEALEFFPQDATSGTVRIITRNLEFIRLSDDRSIFIPMCGEGTYFFNTDLNAYQLNMEVHYDQSGIGGASSVTHYLVLFNKDIDVDLEPIPEDCRPYIEL